MAGQLLCPRCQNEVVERPRHWSQRHPETSMRTCRTCGFSWPYRDYTSLPDDLESAGDSRSTQDRLGAYGIFTVLTAVLLALLFLDKTSDGLFARLLTLWLGLGMGGAAFLYGMRRSPRIISEQERAAAEHKRRKIVISVWGVLGLLALTSLIVAAQVSGPDDLTWLYLLLLAFLAAGLLVAVLVLARIVALVARWWRRR